MMSLSQKWTMTLEALIADFASVDNCPAVAIEGVSLDSRQVQPGDLFVAVKVLIQMVLSTYPKRLSRVRLQCWLKKISK